MQLRLALDEAPVLAVQQPLQHQTDRYRPHPTVVVGAGEAERARVGQLPTHRAGVVEPAGTFPDGLVAGLGQPVVPRRCLRAHQPGQR